MTNSSEVNKRLDAEKNQGYIHVCGPRKGLMNVSDAPSLPIKLRNKKNGQ